MVAALAVQDSHAAVQLRKNSGADLVGLGADDLHLGAGGAQHEHLVQPDRVDNGHQMCIRDSTLTAEAATDGDGVHLSDLDAGEQNFNCLSDLDLGSIADKKYTFKVATDATKVEIAQAVETLFPGVKVSKVNTISVRGRFRRQGMHAGYTAASKKAIVTLTKDSKEIEFFNSMV